MHFFSVEFKIIIIAAAYNKEFIGKINVFVMNLNIETWN